VNKVETRVTLLFDILHSQMLTEEQKEVLGDKLKNRISKEGILQLSSEAERSQSMNKKAVINKFTTLIERALQPVKKRKATKPSRASIKKRLERKKQLSEKKRIRGGKIDM
jgi:ribosome-associated protein